VINLFYRRDFGYLLFSSWPTCGQLHISGVTHFILQLNDMSILRRSYTER
jgi:hypothetical protein